MTKQIPSTIETFDALTTDALGQRVYLAADVIEDEAKRPVGFGGYLVPWYTLADRGIFFVPGSGTKTGEEQLAKAPVLYQHDTWEPIGRHTKVTEDGKGFRIETAINLETKRGAEVISNMAFGTPMGLSIGMDRMAWRSGTPEDDLLLDRSTAPTWLKNAPIEELVAITEFRWWESSVVTFAAIATAGADDLYLAAGGVDIAALTEALKRGQLSDTHRAAIDELVAAYHQLAADGDPTSTSAPEARLKQRRTELALIAARQAALVANGALT